MCGWTGIKANGNSFSVDRLIVMSSYFSLRLMARIYMRMYIQILCVCVKREIGGGEGSHIYTHRYHEYVFVPLFICDKNLVKGGLLDPHYLLFRLQDISGEIMPCACVSLNSRVFRCYDDQTL